MKRLTITRIVRISIYIVLSFVFVFVVCIATSCPGLIICMIFYQTYFLNINVSCCCFIKLFQKKIFYIHEKIILLVHVFACICFIYFLQIL